VIYALYVVHVLVSIFLILVVLLQQGKGADLSVFGGGSTQAAFGARGAATLLHKFTVAGFTLFIVTTLAIAFLQRHDDSGSVMSGVADEAAQEQPVDQPGTTPPPAEESTPAATPDGAGDDGTATEGGGAVEEGAADSGAEAPPPAEEGSTG